MKRIERGTIKVLYDDQHSLAVVLFQEKEENGLPDPDPRVEIYTPTQLEKLPTITALEIQTDPQCSYEVKRILKKRVAWERDCVFEGFFAGTTLYFRNPHLIVKG